MMAVPSFAQFDECKLYGTAYKQDGFTPAVGVKITVRSVGFEGVLQAPEYFTTRKNGYFSFYLPKLSQAYVEAPMGGLNTRGGVLLSIPDADSAAIFSLSTISQVPDSGLVVQNNDLDIAGGDNFGTLDFSSQFTVTRSPVGEANISLSGISSGSSATQSWIADGDTAKIDPRATLWVWELRVNGVRKFAVDSSGIVWVANAVRHGDVGYLNLGLTTTDSIFLRTDGTGTAEVVLPNKSISGNEILFASLNADSLNIVAATDTSTVTRAAASFWTSDGDTILVDPRGRWYAIQMKMNGLNRFAVDTLGTVHSRTGVFRNIVAGTMTIGNASTTQSITLTTDGTGNGEVVLPNKSVSGEEILYAPLNDDSLTAQITSPIPNPLEVIADGDTMTIDMQAATYIFALNVNGAQKVSVDSTGKIFTTYGIVNKTSGGSLVFGSATAASHTFTTDGTGDGEVSLPAQSINTTELTDDAVTSGKIVTDAVGSSEIVADAVGTSEIATDGVGSAEISADAVGSSELASTSVSNGSYGSASQVATFTVDADGRLTAAANATIAINEISNPARVIADGDTTSIDKGTSLYDISVNVNGSRKAAIDTTGKIKFTSEVSQLGAGAAQFGNSSTSSISLTTDGTGDAEVTLPNDAIGSAEILSDAVGSTEIATDAVGTAEIATDGVGNEEIATDAVGSAEIAADAVGISEIATGGVRELEVNWATMNQDSVASRLPAIYKTIEIPAGFFITDAGDFDGATFTQDQDASNDFTQDYLAFADGADYYVSATIRMPEDWDYSTSPKFRVIFYSPTGHASNLVNFEIGTRWIRGATDSWVGAKGSDASQTYNPTTANVIYVTSAFAPTPSGSIDSNAEMWLQIRIFRDGNDAVNDTHTAEARVIAVLMQYKKSNYGITSSW